MRLATAALTIGDEHRAVLETLSKSQTAAHRDVQRARVLLLAADGIANTHIAAQVDVSPATVKAWRERFSQEGLTAFGGVRPGRGRKPSISQEKVAEIVRATLHDTPPAETHWSCRSMAKAQGISPATVQRIWSAHGLKPHRVKTFKLSNDKRFEQMGYLLRSPGPSHGCGQRAPARKPQWTDDGRALDPRDSTANGCLTGPPSRLPRASPGTTAGDEGDGSR